MALHTTKQQLFDAIAALISNTQDIDKGRALLLEYFEEFITTHPDQDGVVRVKPASRISLDELKAEMTNTDPDKEWEARLNEMKQEDELLNR